jgi:hypothetical protein
MRLVKVRPKYFRAFGDADWISLDASLVVLFGPNGFGKTSLTEAVEWLLYGKTKRRERGEALSQRDYHMSYRNAHAPDAEPTMVEAIFRDPDGVEHALKRELQIGARGVEFTRTFFDGAEARFESHGISEDEIYCPVIAQDGLQDFINSRPKERRDKISAALGLEHLVRFKTVLDKARSRFQADAPIRVAQAKSVTRTVAARMRRSAALLSVANKLEQGQFNMKEDGPSIGEAAVQKLGSRPASYDALVTALKGRRSEASRRVFDDSALRMPGDIGLRRQQVNDTKNAIQSEAEALRAALREFVETATAKYGQVLLSFWQTGLGLRIDDSPTKCPMCEQDTLTESKRNELQSRISHSASYTKASQGLARSLARAVQFVRQARARSEAVFPQFMDTAAQEVLAGLVAPKPELQVFTTAHVTASAAASVLVNEFSTLEGSLFQITRLAESPGTVDQAGQIVSASVGEMNRLMTSALEASVAYEAAYLAFRPVLEAEISSSAAVVELDALLAPLENWQEIRIVAEYERLLADALEVVRQVENHVQLKQTERFGSRGQEINDWYDMMNRGAQVRYQRMETGTDSITLWADAFGAPINAAACLSQCQLNCLGLSVHLMRTLTSGSPYGFVLLDDPVQSMDDDHCQALIVDVVKALLDRGTQVVIFSHVQGLVDSVWETYYALQPLRLRIEDFAKSGPTIDVAETLQDTIRRASQLAAGNEENRRLAVKVVRRAVELLIRGACRHTGSTPPPHDANPNNMLPYFRSCTGTTPAQHQGLAETVRFANPGPHTQVGWAVPIATQIVPHIDRIRQTARQLGLIQ